MGSILNSVTTALTPQNNFQANTDAIQSQQQQLAAALQAQSQGQGPNAAQAQYQQNVNKAIQQNAGFVGSQKGINPALAQRQAGLNAASMSQAAAGQEGIMQAQQQSNAQQQEAGVLGTIGTEQNQTSAINAGASAQNAAANQNTAGGLLNGLSGGLLYDGGEVGYDDGGMINLLSPSPNDPTMGQLNAMVPQTQSPTTPAQPQSAAPNASQGIANQILQAAGVTNYAAGNSASAKPSGKQSKGFSQLQGMLGDGGGGTQSVAGGPMDMGGGGDASLAMMASHGATIPDHLHAIAELYHPGKFGSPKTAQLKAVGGPVPGKAKVTGDSPKNDTVKTMLSPGEVVIPRSIMNSADPVKGAANFVAEQLRKHGHGSEEGTHEEFKSALKKAIGSRKAA